jgi:hypothetical protein
MPGDPLNLALAQAASVRVRVMADHGSDGLWEIECEDSHWFHTCADAEDYALPPALARAFEEWIESYSREFIAHLDERMRGEKYDRSAFIARFNKRGRALARRLKRHLGAGAYVEYYPEILDSVGAGEVIA